MKAFVDPHIEKYSIAHSHQPSALCQELFEYTKKNVPSSQMLIGPMEASVLGFFIRATGAKKVLEFGTYTGYSALAMAENLPENAKLVSLDINEETTKIAQQFWKRSKHGNKIQLIMGPALNTLEQLSETFDFVFVDADKENYPAYVKWSLEHLSSGGMIVCDNVLWSGKVLKPDDSDGGATKTLHELNESMVNRDDLFVTLLPIRDGMLLIQKRN